MPYFARPANDSGHRQLLKDHLQNVAERAEQFAAEAGLEPGLGRWAGLLHDLGKYSKEFQEHRLCLDSEGNPNGADVWKLEHACHGACIAELDAAWQNRAISFAVAGHHSGLQDLATVQNLPRRRETVGGETLDVKPRARAFLESAWKDGAFAGLPPAATIPDVKNGRECLDFDLKTRMLFSCLIDADRLDAEGHGDAEKSSLRESGPPLEAAGRLERVLASIGQTATASSGAENLRALRKSVLEHALSQAEQPPGFFSLTVPTGGGKTLTSLAWALRHAAHTRQRRIIFVIPYLSIIEQNVDVIRAALGDPDGEGLVLEHHSNVVDEEDGDEAAGRDGQDGAALRRRLLAENWDAPVIVTTTVRFFETLFSNRPKDARRLHNIARSVVVFDEAQTFPPGMLTPMCGILEQLATAPYNTSFLFCTATQPAFNVEVGHNQGRPAHLIAPEIRELAPDPSVLFAALERVRYVWPQPGERLTPDELAAAMAKSGRAMAVLNTKEQARLAFRALRALDSDAIHLSTRMCAAHRLAVIESIRERLRDTSGRCLVAATQLVEAGVDISFDAVWRAMGPLDSITQAAGRCNREGLLDRGVVTVFRTRDGKTPHGAYAIATGITEGREWDPHDPETFQRYFRLLYNSVDRDANHVTAKRQALDFPAVAASFAIIDDDTTPVLVPWGEGKEIISELRRARTPDVLTAKLRRRMQRYVVGLYPNELAAATGLIEELAGDSAHGVAGVRVFTGTYDEALGLRLPGDFSED